MSGEEGSGYKIVELSTDVQDKESTAFEKTDHWWIGVESIHAGQSPKGHRNFDDDCTEYPTGLCCYSLAICSLLEHQRIICFHQVKRVR